MIVRHIVEISEDDVMTYHFYYLTTTSNDFELPNTKLVTLAPGVRLERRFAPLARGQYEIKDVNMLETVVFYSHSIVINFKLHIIIHQL